MKTAALKRLHWFPPFVSTALAMLSALAAQAAPLSGTKSVGPTGDYPSLTAAIADIQAESLGGALVLELEAAYLSTVETFPLTVPALNGGSAVNTLTLRPATGATALSISSADTTAATVDLNGTQFVTFDGRPGGVGTAKELTIENTSFRAAVRFINEASNNTLRHITLRSANPNGNSGTVLFSTTTGANGNDNNTIDTCDIRDGASTPAYGIYSRGTTTTTAQNNSGNTVTNCNVFNFVASIISDAAGVRLDGGNTDWTISGNSFYQTASRAAVEEDATLPRNVRAIFINNTSGNNFTVTGNFIGGDSPGAAVTTQKWTTTGTTAEYLFQGIRLNVGSTTPSSVQGNTIANIVWTSSSNSTQPLGPLPGVWSGIYVENGNVNIGTVTGNTIGSGTGTGSISVTTSGTGGTSFGIGRGLSVVSSDTVAIANNTIGSITTNGADTSGNPSTSVSASLVGIRVNRGANTISNNTVGSTTTANSLNAVTSSISSTGQQVTGILSSSSGGASITGNTVANLNNNYNSAGTSGQIRGIVTSAGVNTITGNTVRNLSTTSHNTITTMTAAGGQSVVGIAAISTAAGQTVSQNTVHSLANTAASAAVNVTGIYFAAGASSGHVIARNFVHSLAVSSSSATSVVNGMQFAPGTFTAQNNMVRVGLDATGASTAGASVVRGINDSGTTAGRNFYHNSVYVGGTQTSLAANTFAFQSSGASNARTYQNNIFVNARSNSGGTGKHYAVTYGGTTVNPTGLTAGGNLFLASGTGGVLGFYNSADVTTLADWQTATGQDATSLNADPLFVNPTGDATTVDLHLQAASPANNAGLALAAVTDDFDGGLRSLTTPDIGADEFGVTGGTGPEIGVQQPAGTDLTNGVSTVDFGFVTVGASVTNRFLITNSGIADLILSNSNPCAVEIIGGDTNDFVVVQDATSPVAPGGGSPFLVRFTPVGAGAKSATARIVNNDPDENPFDFLLSAIATNAQPTIVCPANITTNNDAGQCAALVSFSAPVVTGDPAPSVSCALGASAITSPHLFPAGTNVVTCTATNEHGATNCSFVVTVIDTQPPVSCLAPPPGMTGWWPGDGNAMDIRGNNHGALTGGVTFAAGRVGQAFHLDGTSGYVTVPDGGGIDPNVAFSYDAWVFWRGHINPSGHDGVVVKLRADGNDSLSTFIAAGDGSFFNILEGNIFSSAANTVPVNQWFHLAATYDGTTARCYLNGNVVASRTAPRVASAGPLHFGNRGGNGHFFNGLIDEVETFSRALSQAEILAIVNAGTNGKCRPQIVNTDPGQCFATVAPPAFTDNCPGGTVVCTPATAPKGTTNVTCVITDASGNKTTNGFTVTVLDMEHPRIPCVDLTNSTGLGQCSAVMNFPPATDNCDGLIPLDCTPTNGTAFPQGVTTVTCDARDTSGFGARCIFTVTVLDTEPPVLSCPTNLVVNSESNCSAVVTFSAAGTDNCDSNVTVVCDPASGSAFPVGTNTVTCSATDAAGNPGDCSFTVRVRDTQRPTVTCPSDISITAAPGATNAVVTFALAAASDNCSLSTNCVPPSGAAFGLGTTIVQCAAFDQAQNIGSCQFTVTVCATNITVTSTNDSGPGSLRQAIADLCPGGVIDFNFHPPVPCAMIVLTSGQLVIDKDMTILGLGPTNTTVMRAADAADFRIFVINRNVTANLSGLTIADGRVQSGVGSGWDGMVNPIYEATGGGLCNMGALVLSNCVVSGNSVHAGNVAGYGGDVTYEAAGGGIYNAPRASLTVIDCTVSNNLAIANGIVMGATTYIAYGGGIANHEAILGVYGSTISGNTAIATNAGTMFVGPPGSGGDAVPIRGPMTTASGGGMASEGDCTVFVENSTISGNHAGASGGFFFANTLLPDGPLPSPPPPPLAFSTRADGGGLWNEGGAVALASVTVASNTVFATGLFVGIIIDDECSGGGLYNTPGPGTVNLTNTIVAGNSGVPGPDVFGAFVSGGHNLIGNPAGGAGFIASDLVNTNALLGPLAGNGGRTHTHALLPGSPAINAGDNAAAANLMFDQRGSNFLRQVGGVVDIGAFEVQGPPLTECLISHWAFDEASGTNALDSADGNPGRLVNNPPRVAGRFGGALKFNGKDQYVNVPDSNSLDLSNRMSISVWFKPAQLINAASGRKDMIQKFTAYWLIFNYPAGDGRLAFVLNSGANRVKSARTSWVSNQWYHAVATYDGTNLALYINGVLEGVTPAGVAVNKNTFPVQFGGNTQQNFWFPGTLDDVRFYGCALSSNAVTALFGETPPPPPPNTPPFLASIAATNTPEDTPRTVPVTVGDAQTAAADLTVVARSDNQALVPDASITPGGGGSNRTLTLTPRTNQFTVTGVSILVTPTGSVVTTNHVNAANISVIVTDAGGLATTNSFLFTVTPVNDPPVISDSTNRTILKNTFVDVPFTIGDVETPASLLNMSFQSAGSFFVSHGFSGTGSNRTVRLTPASDQIGSVTISLTVSDGTDTPSDAFVLTVIEPPPPAPDLIGRWKFDETGGTNALDSAGTNHGRLVNAPARMPGALSNALCFNGTSQHVNIPDNNALDVSNRFTMSLWFKPAQLLNAASGRKDLFKKFLAYWLILNYPAGDGKLAFVLNNGALRVKSTRASWASNQWYHAAATYDGTNMALYINGVLEGTLSATATAANTSNPLQIGGNSEQSYWWPGCLDDARLYSRALTAAEVLALFNEAGALPAPLPLPGEDAPGIHVTLSVDDGFATLLWAAEPGRFYRVQFTDDLGGGNWRDLTDDLLALEDYATAFDPVDTATQRFYRVIELP